LLRVEVVEVGRERGATRVFDTLVDRQDRQVAGTRQAPVREQRLQAAQHTGGAVGGAVEAVDPVGAGQMQPLLGDTSSPVAEKAVTVVAKQVKQFLVH